jgi:hypothetical protein
MKMTIQMVGRLWPRDKFPFFKDNPKLWNELKDGKEIEIPNELFGQLRGVQEVKKVAAPVAHKEKTKVQ